MAGILLTALLVHALWAASQRITSADLWWAMAAGRYIVEHGVVPDRDVFSFTYEGAPWLNLEWLSQVVYFELFQHGGGNAVAVFKIALVVAMFALAAWIGWRRSGSLVLGVGAAVLAAYVCRPYFDIRPQLFLFLGTLAVMAVIEAYRRGARDWVLALLPLIMILWVNLHFSFLYGAGVLLLYAGSEVAKSWLGLPDQAMPHGRALRLATAVVVAVLAANLNPYHVHAFIEPFTIIGAERPWRSVIVEWVPPVLFQEGLFNPAFFGYLLLGQIGIALAALALVPRRFDLSDALLVAVTVVMALSARRFVPLFALVAAPFLAKNLAVLRSRFLPRPAGVPELATLRSAAGVGLVAIAVTGLLLARALPEARQTFAPGLFEGLMFSSYFPRNAVEFLRLNPLPARLFHLYTWGGYVLFELPDRKIFIDGRAHTVYPFDFYRDSTLLENGEARASEVLDRWGVSLVLWPSGIADGKILVGLQQLQASSDWVPIYDDGHSALLAHRERGRAWIDAFHNFTLVYPDDAMAQLFLAQAYLGANAFARGRDQLQSVARRYPETRAGLLEGAHSFLEATKSDGSADNWFALGFYSEVNGDLPGAAAAFRTALERGLEGPQASYAREAIVRLAAPG